MAENAEGRPSWQTKSGGPQRNNTAVSNRTFRASSTGGLQQNLHTVHRKSHRTRIHPGAFVTFLLIVFACVYLVAHVLASLLGWRGAALLEAVFVWALIVVVSADNVARSRRS